MKNTQGVYFPRVFLRFFPQKQKLATRKPEKKNKNKNRSCLATLKKI
jgi:hypothetical protein